MKFDSTIEQVPIHLLCQRIYLLLHLFALILLFKRQIGLVHFITRVVHCIIILLVVCLFQYLFFLGIFRFLFLLQVLLLVLLLFFNFGLLLG